jgi:hypothetical protein
MTWPEWRQYNPQDLAAFVTDQATRWLTLDSVTSLYDLADQLDRYARIVEDIYTTLCKQQIKYDPEEYHPSAALQRVRSPVKVFGHPHKGTCLDLATLFCGLCLGNDLLPILIVLKGHVLVAVSLTHGLRDWNKNRPGRSLFNHRPLTEPDPLRQLIDSGEYVAIECTGFAFSESLGQLSQGPRPYPESIGREHGIMSFERAKAAGREQLDERDFRFALDIAVAHYQWQIEPYPLDNEVTYPLEKSDFLLPVTTNTLFEAQQKAASEIEVEKLKQLSGDEYNKLMNDKALLGCPPEWHHLYLGEFGAFRRLEKEQQILTDINTHLRKLINKQQGLMLHVISGASGCGKSTLAKQILRRLVEHDQLEDYPELNSQKLKNFELKIAGAEQNLEAEIQASIVPDTQEELYVIYFDDLFALEEEEVDRILRILASVAERVRIYFLVTSPSWVFDHKKDLQKRKLTFRLVGYIETIIGGMNKADKEALKDQYRLMYGSNCRQDLLAQIDKEDEAIVLIKLGLHHDMEYSQYLDQLLKRLKTKEPQYLAALLLFSIPARFYVHFPLPLLQSINQELTGAKLPETPDDYETINDGGLRLFRIRKGTRTSPDSIGMPDTLAPFHDRVAQVIYTTWGDKENVPLFSCKLPELRNRVYRKLQGDSHTLPILANIFRGHLGVADDTELTFFVNNYGPVQGNNWSLRDAPIAAYRWIAYSRFNPVRTERCRLSWEQVLENTIRKHEEVGLAVSLAFLSPYKFWERMGSRYLTHLKNLGEDYFLLIHGVLEQMVSINPPPLEFLGDYLLYLVEWFKAHPNISSFYPASLYLVIASLSTTYLPQRGSHLLKSISSNSSWILKAYLLNLDKEYANNEVLGSDVRMLVKKTSWDRQEATELINSLFHSLQDRELKFRPGLMQILLQLAPISDTIPITELFDLFLDICEQNENYSGLTYTGESFGEYLGLYQSKYPKEHREFLRKILTDLTEGKLHTLVISSAYGDFVDDFITQLKYTYDAILPSELFALLKPLIVNFSSSRQTAYVFTNAVTLKLSSMDFQELIHDNYDRLIRLCFAQRFQISFDQTLDEFIAFLEAGDFTFLPTLVTLLANYFGTFQSNYTGPSFLDRSLR